MESLILSLKNIYRLLTDDDFPVYSERVITKRNRKGLTLVRFWNDIIVRDFCSSPYGKMIWKDSTIRSRFFSNLCNRSDEMKYYSEYAQEIGMQISKESLLNQIHRFEEFLLSRVYHQEVLLYRMDAFLQAVEKDPCITPMIRNHLQQSLQYIKETASAGSETVTFGIAYFLAAAALYAAAGTAMGEASMAILRDKSLGVDALMEVRFRTEESDTVEPAILTVYTSLLQSPTLSRNRFFGRERLLFDLCDYAKSGGKYLLSGIGGIGKTELLRQLIRRCCEDGIVDKLAIISYRNSLAESMSYALPGLSSMNQDEALEYALRKLEKEAKTGSLLVVVDNITEDFDADHLLSRLPCTVMVTSRRRTIDGFHTIRVEAPNTDACALIFRDNYGKILSESEYAELDALLFQPEFCHPLMLRLLAKEASGRYWSIAALRRNLQANSIAPGWSEDGYQYRIQQLLHLLYPMSRIPAGSETIVQLFTLLPRDSYSPEQLQQSFPQLFPAAAELETGLTALADGGWLEQDSGGYSMHPLIAQCLRRKTLPQSYLEPFVAEVRSCFRDVRIGPINYDNPLRQMNDARLLLNVLQYLTGSISPELLTDWILAVLGYDPTQQQKPFYLHQMEELIRRCPDKNDSVEVARHALLSFWDMDTLDAVQEIYRQQRLHCTVPPRLFLLLCCSIPGLKSVNAPEWKEEVLQYALTIAADDPSCTAELFSILGVHAMQRGLNETAFQRTRLACEYVEQHPDCSKLIFRRIWVEAATMYVQFGRLDEAEACLDKISAIQEGLPEDIRFNILYFEVAGNIALYRGNLEHASDLLEKAVNLTEEYYGKKQDYYAYLGQLAIVQQRQKNFVKAGEIYREILAFGGELPFFHIARNNYAVLLLDMEKPKEAMPHIEKTIEIARQLGGLALAEALRNQARAFSLLGNFSEELPCLKEALPLLTEAYGPEHPRTTAARERLAQLSAEILNTVASNPKPDK